MQLNLGGPVWHASGRADQESMAWALAERALRGVGDVGLGEWREHGLNGVMHIRRRLTAAERAAAGGLEVRDIRGTVEEDQRIRRLLRDAPALRPIVEALREQHAPQRPQPQPSPS